MLKKFAATQILEARLFNGRRDSLVRTAHRVHFDYEPRHGYLYVRSRMISSRCNDNYDEFPGDEISDGYLTFLGKPVFVNHHNEDHRRMRGLIVDAALHSDRNPDGSPDIWVEGLQEVDALTYPKLAKAIILGHVDRTSMGVDVAHSVCSVCANKATTPLEYCRHIPAMKGAKMLRAQADGRSRSELVRERCHGLSFFENSLLVEEPADPTAFFLDSPVAGPGLEHLGKTASRGNRTTAAPREPIVTTGLFRITHLEPRKPMRTVANMHLTAYASGGSCPGCGSGNTIVAVGSSAADCFDCEHSYALTVEGRLHEDNPLPPLVPHKPVTEMDTGEEKEWNGKVKAHAQQWHAKNPIHPDHIVDHWHAATADEKENGMNWYADAHHGTKQLAEATGTPMHVAAGLVSNYSPQTHWATNITTAAKVMRTKQGVGGKGNKDGVPYVDKETGSVTPKGILASNSQREKGHEMITNHTHYNDLLSGPKTRAFAHLIEHGDDTPEDKAQGKARVVVDRHALSVATGARASDAAYAHSGLSGKKKYGEAEKAYNDAAARISAHEGYPVAGHQVQAVTWLTRQRLNEEHDRNNVMKGSRSASAAQTAIHQMSQYMGEHHPEMSLQMPGTGYSKNTRPTELEKQHYEDHKSNPGVPAASTPPAAPTGPAAPRSRRARG